jgi:hypothetical protein
LSTRASLPKTLISTRSGLSAMMVSMGPKPSTAGFPEKRQRQGELRRLVELKASTRSGSASSSSKRSLSRLVETIRS